MRAGGGSGRAEIDRRSFFKVVATSGAAAAAERRAAVRPGELLSLVTPPDEIVPGVASYFSTVCRECPSGCGVLAKNRDGRVIKLEGNPSYPGERAARSASRARRRCRASTIPIAFAGRWPRASPSAWDEAEKQVADKVGALVKGGQGRKIALVSGLESGSLGAPHGRLGARRSARGRASRTSRSATSRCAPPIARCSGATRSRTTRSARRATSCPSAPTSSRRGSAASATPWASPGCTASSTARRAPCVHVEPRMSMTARQRRRVGAQRAGHRGRARARHAQGDRGRGAGRRRAPEPAVAPRRRWARVDLGGGRDGVGRARGDHQARRPRRRGVEGRRSPSAAASA